MWIIFNYINLENDIHNRNPNIATTCDLVLINGIEMRSAIKCAMTQVYINMQYDEVGNNNHDVAFFSL